MKCELSAADAEGNTFNGILQKNFDETSGKREFVDNKKLIFIAPYYRFFHAVVVRNKTPFLLGYYLCWVRCYYRCVGEIRPCILCKLLSRWL